MQGESRYSWTVDFAARRAKAREEIEPLQDQANAAKAEAVDLKERIKRLKKLSGMEETVVELSAKLAACEKNARDLEAQIAAIDGAVFDLKAVNPNAIAKVDGRSPSQIIASIIEHERIISEALGRLAAQFPALELAEPELAPAD